MGRGRRFMDAIGLQEEPLPMEPLVEVSGDGRVLIENHRGVIQYGCEHIRVKVKFGCICVCGGGLRLSRMTRGQLVISGRIDSIALCRGC